MKRAMTSKFLLKAVVCALPALLFSPAGKGQTSPIYIEGQLSVATNDTLRLFGDVTMAPTAFLYIRDAARIYFYGTNFVANAGAKIYGADASWVSSHGAGTGAIAFVQPNPVNGTSVQQMLSGGNTGLPASTIQNTFTSLVLDNSAGLRLRGSDTRVGTDVRFVNGLLSLGEQNLVLGSAATVSNYGNTHYVVTDSTGHLVKENFSAAFVFPVGHASSDYTPATIGPASGNTVLVRVTDSAGAAGRMGGTDGMGRAWHIYANAATSASFSLQHNSSTNKSGWDAANNFVTQYGTMPNLTGDMTSGVLSPWQSNTPGPSGTTGGAGTEIGSRTYAALPTSPVANESWFSKATNIIFPLPLELKSFTAITADCNAVLYWSTAGNDDNIAGFTVERSTDGTVFHAIATLPLAKGNTEYSYTDAASGLQSRNRYYRLKLNTYNGVVGYSAVAAAHACAQGQTNGFTLYPNPSSAGQMITLLYAGDLLRAYYTVHNVLGQLQLQSAVSDIGGNAGNSWQVNIAGFVPGVYVVTLCSADGSPVRRVQLIVQ
jgi:hypothetical protein